MYREEMQQLTTFSVDLNRLLAFTVCASGCGGGVYATVAHVGVRGELIGLYYHVGPEY